MLAIVLDAAVVSAPIVQTPIFDGEFTISGDFTEDEAGSIAEALSP
jgi:preprotein translocase subunit SecD